MGGYRPHHPNEYDMLRSPNPNSALGATEHKTHVMMYKKWSGIVISRILEGVTQNLHKLI